MPICKGLLASKGEIKVHQILEQYSNDLRVFLKVRFFDIIMWDTPGISDKEHAYLEKTHFDFVVSEPREPYIPIFAVEYDGIGENADQIDPYRELKKATKTRIAETEGLPVVWLENRDIQSIAGETLLDYLIEDYVGNKWIDQLKAEGKIPPDDGYVTIFRPMARLLSKMEFPWFNSSAAMTQLQDGWIEMSRKIEFESKTGMEMVERSFRIKLSNISHFVSPIMFADDVAHYLCLLELNRFIQEGKVVR